ncbi:23S rRNA (uracil(1939)-C(5))-methyltransferase RlmD [Pseudoalteromonas sp. PS5]|uniref:23S rRNA (uracil(1939)-C(5))-methyltransferase RlmD n=1 Tax=Pseudoalteromonas sp. PS5 TaxID=1437473 RepID=UPI000FFE7B26|nr:23S rRNA (uracil(1939)-C(5))-methyltransferase RlmD [Pseudoalteromonas sp. PS5]RXF05266.1 23S rRNA (uracil(1939)-C(5))-methyltransferase RlmD [Pseudoalteromonas sp. PS5]
MAQIFRAKKATKPSKHLALQIESMDHQGRGVARHDGKVCFVAGALTNEHVTAQVTQAKSKLLEAKLIKVMTASEYRTQPFCEHYEQCGGCNLQHQSVDNQLIEKQQAVEKLFARFAKITQLPWQAAITSAPLHYRRAARIASIYDKKRNTVKLGFRASQSKQIVDIEQCNVLAAPFADIFITLNALSQALNEFKFISHVQLCQADNHNYVLFRHTKALSQTTYQAIRAGLENYQVVFDDGENAAEYQQLPNYRLPEFGLVLEFQLNNFIQVNQAVNDAMLHQAVTWLKPRADEKVLDLFCGVGNFSLVLAKYANAVIGVEGEAQSVAMARQNAQTNQIHNVQFHCFDLTRAISEATWFDPSVDVLLLDPSRTGALEVLEQLPLGQFSRILYVSCDPVTLARDAQVIHRAGFTLEKLGLMNMFVHTGHIETMALFVKQQK